MNAIIQQQFDKIISEKERVIKEKFLQLGIDEDKFLEYCSGSFPRIIRAIHPNGDESYHLDNGTKDGLRVVTFKEVKISPYLFDSKDFTTRINMSIQYY